ncbi:coenzyme F420-0:L-glutamate ligase [Microlunatus soli]|uniref:Coenzyme F420-0:L-glutamate ligase / coenzyme F420-1:gamma-L-glutamate ligase n=1 Tax=Microlunatus soli TaxID=630515 RepID=A0A1H1XGM4_9ACTN|nr:coenzyme F420-0:L-glutamate ligase [Microlunatus soli]SDT08414.1 coenzyme F420-0:L-glutamate ligase / coenzyme F420-1:gamma-L-glutamate ligase [Microlunatus soli]
MITIFAPESIGEIRPGDDLAAIIVDALTADHQQLLDGDILVVTSKIVSKAEDRYADADDRQAVIDSETVRTVARRQSMGIVETHHGLTQAGAGVDNSNVDAGRILLLPVDSDASAERLRTAIGDHFGVRIGVVISDTAGRVWRLGQTDHAIGSAGVRVLDGYAGRTDSYGNQLHVTSIAVVDELAAAADLIKSKLTGRPVAVVRGVADQVIDPTSADGAESRPARARDLLRTGEEDLFWRGARESVIGALLAATGHPERYEDVVRLWDRDALYAAITANTDLTEPEQALIAKMITAAQPLWPTP